MDPHKQRPVSSSSVPNGGGNILTNVKSSSSNNPNLDSISSSQSISETRSSLLDCLPDGKVPESASSQILNYLMKIFYQDNEYDIVNVNSNDKNNNKTLNESIRLNNESNIKTKKLGNYIERERNKHDINGVSIREDITNALAHNSLQQQQASLPFLFTNTSNALGVFQNGAISASSTSSSYPTIASNFTQQNLNNSSSFLAEIGVNSSVSQILTSTWPSAATLVTTIGSSLQTQTQTQAGPTNQAPLDNPYQLEALSERWQIFLAILYSLTAITSFILNVVTVIVLARSHRCVLRQYLINLSMSDLLMSLFSIPFTYTEYMLGRWIFASFLCPVVRFVVTLSVFVSVVTMTVIGINRHLAIMYPFRKKRFSRFRQWRVRKTHVIIAIWLVGITISLPEYLMFSAEPFCYNKQYYFDCRQIWPESISNQYTIFIYLCTFAIPLSLLSYLYAAIGLKLWRRQMPGNSDANRDLTMHTMRVKVIKMLFVVVILFAISWLPLQTFSMIMFLYPEIREDFEYQSIKYNIFIGTYFACHWLSMAHSCLNPLIYCFMNDKFRSDLNDLLGCNNRNSYSHHALSLSTNKSFHLQSTYQNNSNQHDHQVNISGNYNTSNNNSNNNEHIFDANRAIKATSIKSNWKKKRRSLTLTSSSLGATTGGRVAHLSLTSLGGANVLMNNHPQVMINPVKTMATLVTATTVTTTTNPANTAKQPNYKISPNKQPTFEANSYTACSEQFKRSDNNRSDETASKNENVLTNNLKDSTHIARGNSSKSTSNNNEETSESVNLNSRTIEHDGGVVVKVFLQPRLEKRRISTIYKWPQEERFVEKIETNKTGNDKQEERGETKTGIGNEYNIHDSFDNEDGDEDEDEDESEEDEDEEDEEEKDFSDETSDVEGDEENALKMSGISNV